jgi:hypothetical protein
LVNKNEDEKKSTHLSFAISQTWKQVSNNPTCSGSKGDSIMLMSSFASNTESMSREWTQRGKGEIGQVGLVAWRRITN